MCVSYCINDYNCYNVGIESIDTAFICCYILHVVLLITQLYSASETPVVGHDMYKDNDYHHNIQYHCFHLLINSVYSLHKEYNNVEL